MPFGTNFGDREWLELVVSTLLLRRQSHNEVINIAGPHGRLVAAAQKDKIAEFMLWQFNR